MLFRSSRQLRLEFGLQSSQEVRVAHGRVSGLEVQLDVLAGEEELALAQRRWQRRVQRLKRFVYTRFPVLNYDKVRVRTDKHYSVAKVNVRRAWRRHRRGEL